MAVALVCSILFPQRQPPGSPRFKICTRFPPDSEMSDFPNIECSKLRNTYSMFHVSCIRVSEFRLSRLPLSEFRLFIFRLFMFNVHT